MAGGSTVPDLRLGQPVYIYIYEYTHAHTYTFILDVMKLTIIMS